MCKNIFENNSMRIYDLIKCGKLDYDNLLWYQSCTVFSELCKMAPKENALQSLRNFISEKLGTKDESELIEGIQQSYRKCYDYNKVMTIPTPDFLKKRFFTSEIQIERWTLIKILFALGATRGETDKFLNMFSFKKLSHAVPVELIIIYLLENGRHKWKEFVDLQKKIEIPRTEEETRLTDDESKNYKMESQTFVTEILLPCCRDAATKTKYVNNQSQQDVPRQFSATERNLVAGKSLDKEMANSYIEDYETVFLTNTVIAYTEEFKAYEYYGFHQLKAHRSMSLDNYIRFLNYRIIVPNTSNNHNTGYYSMDSGKLPKELVDSIIRYSEITSRMKRPYRIERSDVFVTEFYYFLMKNWRDKKNENNEYSFYAKDHDEAKNLFDSFLQDVNATLEKTGYGKFSNVNLLDKFLKFALLSASPLEVYNRVYELNILSDLHENKVEDDKSKKIYPPRTRITRTLKEIRESYRKLLDNNIVTSAELQEIENFAAHCEQNLQNLKFQ